MKFFKNNQLFINLEQTSFFSIGIIEGRNKDLKKFFTLIFLVGLPTGAKEVVLKTEIKTEESAKNLQNRLIITITNFMKLESGIFDFQTVIYTIENPDEA